MADTSTEQERAEVIYTDQGLNVVKDGVLVSFIPWAEVARRAPVVPQEIAGFIRELAEQKPEKPDYWSSCSQCERNASAAEDLLPLLAAAPQQPEASE